MLWAAEKCSITNTHSVHNEGGGLSLHSNTAQCSVTVVATDNGRDGIYVKGYDHVVRGSQCVRNEDTGIGIDGERIVVNGNYCLGNYYCGISAKDSKQLVITNNICRNNNRADMDDIAGIKLEGTTTECVIVGNRCFDDRPTKLQRYGILEVDTSDFNTILANDCVGNAVAGVSKVGGNTHIGDVESQLLLVRGAGAAITGNAGTTYAFMTASDNVYNPDRFCRQYLKRVEWVVAWDPQTTAGGARLYNADDAETVSESVPGVTGYRVDTVNVTTYFKGLTAPKTLRLETKGDGTTAPTINFSLLRIVMTGNVS